MVMHAWEGPYDGKRGIDPWPGLFEERRVHWKLPGEGECEATKGHFVFRRTCEAPTEVIVSHDQSPYGRQYTWTCVGHVPYDLSKSTTFPGLGRYSLASTHVAAAFWDGLWRVTTLRENVMTPEHHGCCWDFASHRTVVAWVVARFQEVHASTKYPRGSCTHTGRHNQVYSCSDEVQRMLAGRTSL